MKERVHDSAKQAKNAHENYVVLLEFPVFLIPLIFTINYFQDRCHFQRLAKGKTKEDEQKKGSGGKEIVFFAYLS